MGLIKGPFGATDVIALTATGAQTISITNEQTIIDGVTVQATGNRTLNLTVSSEIKAGAMLYIKVKATATETTIMGTGMTGPTITGVAGKTHTVAYWYDGTTFKPSGTAVQID